MYKKVESTTYQDSRQGFIFKCNNLPLPYTVQNTEGCVFFSIWEKWYQSSSQLQNVCFTVWGRDFHYDRLTISKWKVEIFIWRSRFSKSQNQIFMITGEDFHDYNFRFSWWQVHILKTTTPYFHDDRSLFSI